MTDYYALLGLPRRPWIDPDLLKQKFLALTAEHHPDHAAIDPAENRAAQEHYAELNAANACLRSPKDRLTHLLQLEEGSRPSELQNVPGELMKVFMDVSDLCRAADKFLAQKREATSPLLKVQLFEQGQEVSEKVAALQAKLGASRDELIGRLKQVDRRWDGSVGTAKASMLAELEELRRLFGFYDRWLAQLQERSVQLAL